MKPSAYVAVGSLGPTTRGPLRWIVHSLSGDKTPVQMSGSIFIMMMNTNGPVRF
ncbi:unnamed protein product [Penicillium camemberti]|uniref:Str. FM013 n=1 Tax=Penicillium camemberti (strain FM 013) TaxID=1429867 RepID=A0A0G4P093_PENC3|nr:unnamed protein product [Penicillium camemberti]